MTPEQARETHPIRCENRLGTRPAEPSELSRCSRYAGASVLGGSDLVADERVQRVTAPAAHHEGERHDAPEQRIFKTAFSPEEADAEMNLQHGHRHKADHKERNEAGSEAGGEHEPAEKLNEPCEQRQGGGQAKLGGKELTGRLDPRAAEPA